MIDILLKILMAVFAVFGLYAFAHALGELCFRNDRIRLMILVDCASVAEQIELYIEEAKSARFLFENRNICAIIMEEYATDELLQTLKRRKVSWEIVTDREKLA